MELSARYSSIPPSFAVAVCHRNYNSYSMDSVRLDDLVLERCASQMGILQELVNLRFANILRLANKSSKISLSVHTEQIKLTDERSMYQLIIGIICGSKCANWRKTVPPMYGWEPKVELIPMSQQKEQNDSVMNGISRPKKVFIRLKDESLNKKSDKKLKGECAIAVDKIHFIILEIFSRFQRFYRVTFSRSPQWMRIVIDIMLNIFSQEEYLPTSFKKLFFTTGTYCDDVWNQNFQISESNSQLIEIVAPLLEEMMMLDAILPHESTDLSKRFWNAISRCAQLKKLYLCRQREGPNLFLNDDVRDCLKTLNIREFHTYENNEEGVLNAKWLFESFRNNVKIRKIFINPYIADVLIYLTTDPIILPIIARLRSIEISIWTELFHNVSSEKIVKNSIYYIARALPENGILSVELVINNPPATMQSVTDDFEVVKALSFWIKLSDDTKRPIHMYARIHHHHTLPAIAIRHEAVDCLEKVDVFAGIKIVHCYNRSILQFNNARIALYFKLLTWKPYLTEEYVGNKAGHYYHVG